MAMKHHELCLESNRFDKIQQKNKSVLITTNIDKAADFAPQDMIVVKNAENPYRSIMINIESLITAKTLEKLYSLCSKGPNNSIRTNNFVIVDNDYAAKSHDPVIGIKYSIAQQNHRSLQEIMVPFDEVEEFIAEATKNCDSSEANEWFQLFRNQKNDNYKQASLEEIITNADGLVKDYVFGLSAEYRDQIDYDEERTLFYDEIYELFPITEWWDKTRDSLVRYFCAEYPPLSNGCHYDTVFD